MANTDRATGKDVYIAFGGTDISADFTSVSVSESGENVDLTAADDTYHYYASLNRTDGTIEFSGFYDSAANGSAVWTKLAPNTAGTLTVGPLGTAAGKPKREWARVLVASRDQEMPFDGGITVSASFQISAALSETTY